MLMTTFTNLSHAVRQSIGRTKQFSGKIAQFYILICIGGSHLNYLQVGSRRTAQWKQTAM